MGFDHRAYRGFVFHPDRRTCPHHEEIPSKPTELKGTPTLKPVCGLALVAAAHGRGVEGQGLLWHDHSTTQEAGDPVAYGQKTALRTLAVYRRKSLRSSTGLAPHFCS